MPAPPQQDEEMAQAAKEWGDEAGAMAKAAGPKGVSRGKGSKGS